jgi:uncharacterized protein YdeI (YjbR/CyaY-like superfamily)
VRRAARPSADETQEAHPTPSPASLPQVTFATQSAWRRWLGRHHSTAQGVWLQFAKQASGVPSVTHAEALDTALCHGWIDGQTKRLDQNHWLQKFTPRQPNSIWSRINRQKALDLIKHGLMQPAGHAAIERAKANGRWAAAYEAQSKAAVPPDLQTALEASPKAAAFFKTLSSQNRYAILFRLQTAKKPETRASRLTKFIAMLTHGETLH